MGRTRQVAADTSVDGFLGERLMIAQPRHGHRSGIEAVLIAAAAPLEPGQTIADLGAGAGVAGLCALARVAGSRALLVEADPAMTRLARANAAHNGLADRVEVVEADLTARGAAARAGLAGLAHHAIANPPFHDPAAARISPRKAAAHAAPPADLDGWVRFAAAVVRPGGTLTLIHRADALTAVLAAFERRFGAVAVLPVHPRAGLAATRILVQGRKGSRGALAILPGLMLHGADGHGFLPPVEAVLRHGAALPLRP